MTASKIAQAALSDDAAQERAENQRRGAGRNVDQRRDAQVIHADLGRDDHATARGIFAHGSSPVLKLCRLLVDAGHDPGLPLEAWRNGVLCLRIRSIGETSGLEINAHGTGFRRLREWGAAPPIVLIASDHPKRQDDSLWRRWPPSPDDGGA